MECSGKASSERIRLPARMAKYGLNFSLMRIKIPAIDASKAKEGFNISAPLCLGLDNA